MELEPALQQYGNDILKYCYGILCDYHEAQDAMQDTFIKAYRSRESIREPEAYRPWLYKIAYRTCLNILQSKRKLLFVAVPESSYNMDEPFPDPELLAALASLSPQDRAIFYSRAVEGMDYSQLESLYQMRGATLRKRYERAKKKLKDYLTANGYGIVQI